jgi:hypothetical protein
MKVTEDHHLYLGTVFDFSKPGLVTITMSKYVETILAEHDIKSTADSPAAEKRFDISADSPILPEK